MATIEDFGDSLIDDTFAAETDILLGPKELPPAPSTTSTSKPTVTKRKRKNVKEAGFKKAPQAPKRFKSPYILFSISRMEEYKRELGPKTKVTSLSSIVADEWKKLPIEERKKWDEVARKDKERYMAEKCLYTGPWQVPSKRTRKDPSAPKRPMSAFLLYSQGMRQKLRAENPTLKNTEISRLLGEKWKNAPEEERRPHVEREKREREQYNKDISEWRKKREEEEKAMRKHRQEVVDQWMQTGQLPQYAQPWMHGQVTRPTVVQVQGNPTTILPPSVPTTPGYAPYPPQEGPPPPSYTFQHPTAPDVKPPAPQAQQTPLAPTAESWS